MLEQKGSVTAAQPCQSASDLRETPRFHAPFCSRLPGSPGPCSHCPGRVVLLLVGESRGKSSCAFEGAQLQDFDVGLCNPHA